MHREGERFVGRFEIEKEVGRGGASIVYRANDLLTDVPVALKVYHRDALQHETLEASRREAEILSTLRHPSIVKLVASGANEEGTPYLAMEWLQGQSLDARLRESRLEPHVCVKIAIEIGRALTAAHKVGVVHRDIKPSNVYLSDTFEAKLVDFGIATRVNYSSQEGEFLLGTPSYMAPEQARSETVDERADIYSLGATLFEMLSGRPPHIGPTPIAVLAKLATTASPRLSDVGARFPEVVEETLTRMLASDRDKRPRGMAEVVEALERLLTDRSFFESVQRRSSVSGLQVGGTRIITTLLASSVPRGDARDRILAYARAHGAEASELGTSSLVMHWGLLRSFGDEAATAVDVGVRLAALGARVGVASGRSRIAENGPAGEVVDRAGVLANEPKAVVCDAATMVPATKFAFRVRADGAGVVSGPAPEGKLGAFTPLIGREVDLRRALRSYDECIRGGRTTTLALSGPAGIGKSRLLREIAMTLAARAKPPRVVYARCDAAMHDRAFGLASTCVRTVLQTSATATNDDSELEGILTSIPGRTKEILRAVLSGGEFASRYDPEAVRATVWSSLTEIVGNYLRSRAVVVVIEDIHHADRESLEWFGHLCSTLSDLPTMFLLTTRPHFWKESYGSALVPSSHRIDLAPLSQQQATDLAQRLMGKHAESPEGRQMAASIAVQCAGSPLFAEELSKLAVRGHDASVASSVEAAMQVQIDALEDPLREALVAMSVYGITCTHGGLDALEVPDGVSRLEDLTRKGLLLEHADPRFRGQRQWGFSHAILRDVAYASLPDDLLKGFHERAGGWLAHQGEDPAAVAKHYELAGDLVRAGDYLEKVARRALATHALGVAIDVADKALLFSNDPQTTFRRAKLLSDVWAVLDPRASERETALLAMRDAAYDERSRLQAEIARLASEDARGGFAKIVDELLTVRGAATAMGLWEDVALITGILASRYAYSGNAKGAEEEANRLLELSAMHQFPRASIDAWQTIAIVRQSRGELGRALEARFAALEVATKEGLRNNEAILECNIAFALTMMGAKDEAFEHVDRGATMATLIGSPGTLQLASMILLCWCAYYGEPKKHGLLASERRDTAKAALASGWIPHDRISLGSLFYHGIELLREGTGDHVAQAEALLRLSVRGYEATKMYDVLPAAKGFLAHALRRLGNHEEALRIAAEATVACREGLPSLLSESIAFAAYAEVLLATGHREKACEALRQGLPYVERRVATVAEKYQKAFRDTVPENQTFYALVRDCLGKPSE